MEQRMTRVFYICLLSLLTCSAAAQTAADTVETSLLADQIIEVAKQYIGRPYRYGSGGPSSFDCSGFTSFIYGQFGYKLDRTSAGQGAVGRPVEPGFENLQKGDLVLFSRRGHAIGHVGIFIEQDTLNNSFKFIHSATHGGVMISNYYEQYYKSHYRFARRLLPDFDQFELGNGDYPFDSLAQLYPDALQLDESDIRIVLFGNGRWAYVSPDGKATIPADSSKIMLSPDGRWGRAVRSVAATAKPVSIDVKDWSSTVSSADASQSAVTVASPSDESTSSASEPEKQYYTVRKGDTLFSIAKKHGTSVASICRLSGIRENSTLQIGQKLRVK